MPSLKSEGAYEFASLRMTLMFSSASIMWLFSLEFKNSNVSYSAKILYKAEINSFPPFKGWNLFVWSDKATGSGHYPYIGAEA